MKSLLQINKKQQQQSHIGRKPEETGPQDFCDRPSLSVVFYSPVPAIRRFPQPDKQDGGRRVRHIAFHMFP